MKTLSRASAAAAQGSTQLTFPPTRPAGPIPLWTGTGFAIGNSVERILCYNTGSSGWTEELTELHEGVDDQDHYMSVASREQAIASLERFIEVPEPVILDIGCSSGYTLMTLRRRMPRATLLGADYVRRPLEKLGAVMPDLPLLQFNVTDCPLEDSSVDAVVLLNILEHIEDDGHAVDQLYRILRPGGIAVIEVPAGPHLYDIYDRRLMHFRRYRLSGLADLMRRSGFQVVNASHLGFFFYPGFWIAKQRTRRLHHAPEETQQAAIDQSMRMLGHSQVLHSIFALERALGRWISYPFGIRCIVTCRKPW